MKYLKTLLYEFIILLIGTFITTTLYYFNITSNSVNKILNILVFIITFILSGIYIGKNSLKKFYLEGIKISGINILIFLLISLVFKLEFSYKNILYYLIIIMITVFSSILGSLLKKKK